MKNLALSAIAAAVLAGWVVATSVQAQSTQALPAGSEKLMMTMQKHLPGIPVAQVFRAEMPGFFGLELDNGRIIYGHEDANFFYYGGDLYEIGEELVNVTEMRRVDKRKRLMDAEPVENMVVFSPKGPARTYVNIFTDVDCGYCRKLHQEMAEYNALGIEVRYLAYPRAGLGTPTAAKIISAWCADDRNAAMTALKSGQSVPSATCDNPVAHQYDLGQQVGVNGTPAIVTADGRMLPGYMPAAALAEQIGLD